MKSKSLGIGFICILLVFLLDRGGTMILLIVKGPEWFFSGRNIWYVLGPMAALAIIGLLLIVISCMKKTK